MASQSIMIRQAIPKDSGTVEDLAIHTFRASFGYDNTEEDLEHYLEKNFNSEKIRKELSSNETRFYLAELRGEAVGYLKTNINHAQTDQPLEDALEIERVYTLPEYQGKGIGQQLLEMGIQAGLELNRKQVWLGVWEKNIHAIRFYKRHGFTEFGEHKFKLGNDIQRDLLFKYVLL
jgi:ribosomal protein S18 acetylase RimI-like enzyme